MIVTRFAPSPNGPLHLGHAYSAVVAHDLADRQRGRFVLRIEDVDGSRARPGLDAEFRRDLAWLGLAFAEVPAQSARSASYREAAFTILRDRLGVLYPCTCTRARIARSATAWGPEGPLYAGTCRTASPDPGTGPVAWRLDVARAQALAGPLEWEDALAGPQQARPGALGDVVLVRRDGAAAYHLAVTLDDAADGVTLVTRGADLFAATHVHRLLQALLGLPVPMWHHHALLVDRSGAKLAKTRGSPALADRRRAGEDGHALADALRAGRLPAGILLAPSLHGRA